MVCRPCVHTFSALVSMSSRGVNTWCLCEFATGKIMLGVLAKYIQDVSVIRRLLFAVVFLSPDLPMYWGVVVEFATAGKVPRSSVTPDQVKALVENIEYLDATAFQTDLALQREIIFTTIAGKKPLGIPLISPCTSCLLCGSKLQLRNDRHAPVVIYDIKHGTVPGAHFVKFCPKRTCSFTQYYGYYSSLNKIRFNPDWSSLEYFLSSRDTAFSLEILRRLDANTLIGHLSFKQQASIYNYTNGYLHTEAAILSRYVNNFKLSHCIFCTHMNLIYLTNISIIILIGKKYIA